MGSGCKKKDFRINSFPRWQKEIASRICKSLDGISANLFFLTTGPRVTGLMSTKRDTIWTSLILTPCSQPTYLQSARRMAAAKRSIRTDDMLSLKLMVTYIYVSVASKRVRSAVYRAIDLDSSGVRRLGIQHNLPAKWHSPINSRPKACDINWSCWVWGLEGSIF